jgi:hypothetical protein
VTTDRIDQPQPPERGTPAANQPGEEKGTGPSLKALPPGAPQSDSGQPGGGQGRIDVVGIVPEGIRVDPDLTEGHPGYEESGDSEIIPPQRLDGRGSAAQEGTAG